MANHPFVPTDAMRKTVETMSGYGIPQPDIARCIGCDPKTLRKYFADEIDVGLAKGNVNVGKSIYDQAVGRAAEYDGQGRLVREELKPDKTAAIFLSKVRLGYKETSRTEIVTAPSTLVNLDLTVLTQDELETFMALYRKVLVGPVGNDDEEIIEGEARVVDAGQIAGPGA